MKCTFCNREVLSTFKYCHNCGTPLRRSLNSTDTEGSVRIQVLNDTYCVGCSARLPANALFCPKCGINLNSRNGFAVDGKGNPTTTRRDDQPEPKPEPKRDPKPEPKPEPKPDPKPEPKPEPKPDREKEPTPKKDRLRQVFFILCAIGICILAAGLGGKIVTGRLAKEIQQAGLLKEIERDYGSSIAESMEDVANEFVIALMRNDPSRFTKKIMGYAGSELGEAGAIINGLSDMFVAEMFRTTRSAYNGSLAIWLIYQVSAYYIELLIAGAAIAIVFGLLWLIRRRRLNGTQTAGGKPVTIILIISVCWIIFVIICTATAIGAL